QICDRCDEWKFHPEGTGASSSYTYSRSRGGSAGHCTRKPGSLISIQTEMKKNAIVIGAGVVGLATARALAVRGYRVKVFERGEQAVGASIRNFGMVWPIGQAVGVLYDRALRSNSIWKGLLGGAGLWYGGGGSLHRLYEQDE